MCTKNMLDIFGFVENVSYFYIFLKSVFYYDCSVLIIYECE